MLATENRTLSRIKSILAIALPVVGRQIRTIRVHGAILVALLGLVVSGFSQITISTGGVQGTVTDPSGALPISIAPVIFIIFLVPALRTTLGF
jgi:hypothetical protein